MSTNENSANSIAAVLFDLDGTLLDTADDLGAALNHVLNTYKKPNVAEHTCLYPGVAELLQQLEDNNIPWGIITNKPEGLTKTLMPYYPEFANCAVMVGGDTLVKRKPDPEPILHACQQINVNNQQCFYVGDALRDIQAGNSALMKTFVANWGYILADEDCQTWQADHIIESPTDLLAFIK